MTQFDAKQTNEKLQAEIAERKRVEQTLREQANLLSLTHDAIIVRDMNRVIRYWNRGAAELYGWAAEQSIGKVIYNLLKTVFPVPVEQIEFEVMNTGRWEGELVHTKKDGIQIVVASRWSLQQDDEGSPVGFLVTNNDITERKRAEEALRRSEAYLAEAQRLTHTGSWAYNSAGVLYWSEEMFRIFGLDPQEGLPSVDKFFERIHPEDRDWLRERIEKTLCEKVDHVHDHRIVLPDGTVKHIHVIGHPVLNDAGGVVEVVGTLVDITERKRAEEELRAAETRFRTFVDHATDALFVHDEQGKIIDVNWQACVSLSYTREELIGMHPRDFNPDVDAAFEQSVRERLKAGEICTLETSHRRKDGTAFPVEVRIRPFWHDGCLFGLALVRDITDRKRAEEALQKAQAELAHVARVATLGEMITSIAHEINQPLAAVVNNASACLRWLAAQNLDEARQCASLVIADCHRASEIIGRIRALVKKTPTQKDWLDINDAIREVIALVRSEAQRNAVVIETQLTGDLPLILGDRIQLQQVILNLMMNAIEAMSTVGEDSRGLWVSSERVESGEILIAVRDSGPGIDPKSLDHLFDAFYTTKPQGLGMGLAISRSIIEAHGGRLWATANVPHGAVFQFTLPISNERVS